jgi:hypothetical protein
MCEVMMRIALLAITMAISTGCTTIGRPYSAPPAAPEGCAFVYLFRTSVGQGIFWPTHLSVNDTKVASLYDKGYTWIYLDAGTYKFSAGTVFNSDYLKFVMPIEAGNEYFMDTTKSTRAIGRTGI